MAVGLWAFLLLFCLVVAVYHGIVLTKLSNFYYYRTNPTDLCECLEQKVRPMVASQIAIVFLSVITLFSSLPILVPNALILVYMLRLRARAKGGRRVFEPMTIVRDLDRVQKRHLTGFVASVLFSVYALVVLIVGILRKD